MKIELRPFVLNINTNDLHKNREMPGAFWCYLGVIDATLPLKGTAHRKVRGTPESDATVNVLLTGDLDTTLLSSATVVACLFFPLSLFTAEL